LPRQAIPPAQSTTCWRSCSRTHRKLVNPSSASTTEPSHAIAYSDYSLVASPTVVLTLQPTEVIASEKGRPTRRINSTSPTNRFRPSADRPRRQSTDTTEGTHIGCLPCKNSSSREILYLLPLGPNLSSYRKHNSLSLRLRKSTTISVEVARARSQRPQERTFTRQASVIRARTHATNTSVSSYFRNNHYPNT
jgi:hypothetical protein